VLAAVDEVILTDIYPAGEAPIAGITSDALAEAIEPRGPARVIRAGSVDDLPGVLDERIQDGDLVLVMGAGDIGRLPAMLDAEAA